MGTLYPRIQALDVINERGFEVRGTHPSKTATSGAASSAMVFNK
jgi:hypothetical protein